MMSHSPTGAFFVVMLFSEDNPTIDIGSGCPCTMPFYGSTRSGSRKQKKNAFPIADGQIILHRAKSPR